jgi:hypothetical protein
MHPSTKVLRTSILAIDLGLAAASCGGGEWVNTGVGNCDELTTDADARAAAENGHFPQMCEGSAKPMPTRGVARAGLWRSSASNQQGIKNPRRFRRGFAFESSQ